MLDNKYYITQETYNSLQKEYQKIKLEDKPAVLERVKESRDLGALEDNQEYEAARDAQNVLEGRILEIEDVLEKAEIIEKEVHQYSGVIELGSKVTVDIKGNNQTFTIVGSIEADPAQGKISHESPVGEKLLGLKEGDEVEIELPNNTIHYKILQIHK